MLTSKLLTIVIPCKNEKDNLSTCLTYLNDQINIKKTKVIIADSSDDDTIESINLKKFKNLNIEVTEGGLPAKARNNGAKLAKTSYVLFLDADVFLTDPKTIDETIKDAICYDKCLITIKFRTESILYSYYFKIFEYIRDNFFKKPMIMGGYMLFCKDYFWMNGGFDEKCRLFEDYNLSLKTDFKKVYLSPIISKTSDRRFRKKGLFYLFKISFLTYLNRNNPSFFYSDHNYWN